MNGGNITKVTEILLLGFKNVQKLRGPLFVLLLLVYCVTVCVNILIIILVSTSKSLHSPMYFFLSQLSLADILLTTDIIPIVLVSVLNDGLVMSFTGCITQFYVFGGSESSECFILTIMAYDRYLAICNPLRYTLMMNFTICLKSVLCSWFLSFSFILVTTLMLSALEYCGPNVIDHFFCDFAPILELSCSETSAVQLEVVLLSIPVMIFPLIIIMVSYGCIVMAILQLPSHIDRWKSFSTCSSHLTVVCIFYGTLIVIYILPTKGFSLSISKVIAVLYTMVTPMLNPLIYSLKNKDIKCAIENFSKIWAHRPLY
ncbi:PREDICTED: olfactory receptor 11L1-like [Nanorana parkeri]|uniref:olfactory receptor 11L1-like n=1 Tax=Nanorana parkeri TaxID=125878 RepID=UPI000854E20A|nr:PREDICTED: olfactory receptor 11L1-like [Nanorana parkeri]